MTNLLNILPLLLINTQIALEKTFCQELWLNSITGLIAFVGISLAAFLAYRFALKQKEKEIFIGLAKLKYERKLAAIEECWKLLAFTSETENDQTVLIWKQNKVDKIKTYFINLENARQYIKQLAACFYGSGLGIYLSQETKKLLFEYRGILFTFLMSVREREEKTLKVTNDKMHKRMVGIHHELIIQLKKETEAINKQD